MVHIDYSVWFYVLRAENHTAKMESTTLPKAQHINCVNPNLIVE